MSDIQIQEERQIARADDGRYFDLIMRQAQVLAESKIIPAAYRRQEADIVAAGLAGRAFGWDTMASMRNFHVIEGSASMKPEAMLGLVRQAGHSVIIENGAGVVTAIGKRVDTGDEHSASFSLADAEAAGLAGKRNWKQYQESMLTWRAVSKLCRNLFSDVVLGAGYVSEELGADVGPQGVPLVPSAKAKTLLVEEFGKEQAIELWSDRGSNGISEEDLQNLLAVDAEIIDAETVEAVEV